MTASRNGYPHLGSVTVTEMGAGRLISLDRQVAEDLTIDISAQMLVILTSVKQRLADFDAHPSHILSVRIDLADASGYQETMQIWTAWAALGRVAVRATVVLLAQSRGPLVEVTIVAAFTPQQRQH